MKISKASPQNSSETVKSETGKKQDLIEKYRRKDIYLQRKDIKLLMI